MAAPLNPDPRKRSEMPEQRGQVDEDSRGGRKDNSPHRCSSKLRTGLHRVRNVTARSADIIPPRADATIDLAGDYDILPRDVKPFQCSPENPFAFTLRVIVRRVMRYRYCALKVVGFSNTPATRITCPMLRRARAEQSTDVVHPQIAFAIDQSVFCNRFAERPLHAISHAAVLAAGDEKVVVTEVQSFPDVQAIVIDQ